ncbi:hypothetical protein HYALB_00004537 [Hymenoscyphus albidus]|uniref:Uncharacterized protein n=1 Tax=Hymenoscyphus albidus TaxID=595503 RepID=A0A9N9M1R3_9HELO|nr:hypothetical protein HYALB_00004537 [Hymenoscyphus albidus]
MSSYTTLSTSTYNTAMARIYCSATTSGSKNLRRGDDDGRDSGYDFFNPSRWLSLLMSHNPARDDHNTRDITSLGAETQNPTLHQPADDFARNCVSFLRDHELGRNTSSTNSIMDIQIPEGMKWAYDAETPSLNLQWILWRFHD